jgi:hypothetical protein
MVEAYLQLLKSSLQTNILCVCQRKRPRSSATYRLAQLAGDAPLLTRRVPPQSMLSSEPGTERTLLKGIVDLHSSAQSDCTRDFQP